MMCNIEQLYATYFAHIAYPTKHHREMVKLARLAIEIHRKTCPECRFDGMRSNYNLVVPEHSGYKRQPGRRRKEMEIVTREGER